MAVQKLGDVAVGTVVKLTEDGAPIEYLVVHKGKPNSLYDDSCSGVWLLRKRGIGSLIWGQYDNRLPDDSFFPELYSELFNRFEQSIQEKIKEVKIPYCQGDSSTTVHSGADGYACKIFILSAYEIGWTTSDYPIPVDGAKLDYFLSGVGTEAVQKRAFGERWATRSQVNSNSRYINKVDSDGTRLTGSCTSLQEMIPAIIMPEDLVVDDEGNILVAPPVPVLTTPSNAMQGQPIPVSWTASETADSYTLQRKADSGAWETIYTGADLQYQDTAGSWRSVQYQVAASAEGLMSGYAQSAVIPVVSASALVISGSDEDLGVIANDISYTVTSDTGNEITMTRKVNGILVAKLTVQSGFAYTIPVMDLPTGSGTIEVTASVKSSSEGTVTASRTWTYTKTAITFPSAGNVALLTLNGQSVFPPTLAEAVRVPAVWGGSMDKALELLLPVVNAAVISVGTYEGTGTFGADNPNTLTFDDTPLVVTIYGAGQTLVISSTDTGSPAYIDGNQAKWYSTESASAQMNTDGVTYSYVAVGKQV